MVLRAPSTTPAGTAAPRCAARVKAASDPPGSSALTIAGATTCAGSWCRSPRCNPATDFDRRDYPLYGLPLTDWNGFIFVALTDNPPAFAKSFDLPLNRLDDWQMGSLAVGHTLRKTIECNWKVFWENYNECLHCPNVHPKLAQLVPIFGRALLERRDDPHLAGPRRR